MSTHPPGGIPPLSAMRRTTSRHVGSHTAGVLLLATLFLACLLLTGAAAKQYIVINSSYSPPYSAPDRNGYFDLVLIEAFGRLGYLVQVNMLPAQRSLHDAATGAADGDIGRMAGIEDTFPTLVRVPVPALQRREFVAFTRTMDVATTGWESLDPFHVAYVEGWQLFEANTTGAASVTPLRTTETLFRFLDHGRCDIALNARLDGMAMVRKLGMTGVRVLEPPLAVKPMYLYLHESRRNLVAPLADTLREMRDDGTLADLKARAVERYIGF